MQNDTGSDRTERRFQIEEGLLADGFTILPNTVLRRTDLSGNAKALYAIILDVVLFQREEPTLADLGDLLGGSEKVARAAIKALAGAGLLKRTRRGQGHSDRYELLEPSQNGRNVRSRNDETADPSYKDLPKTNPTVEANASTADETTRDLVLVEPEAVARPASQTLVSLFVDEARARGSDPPKRVVGAIARNAKQLLDEGRTEDEIAAGFRLMLDRGLANAALLAQFVTEAQLRPRPRDSGQRYGRRDVTAAEMLALADKLEREEQM